MKNILLILAYEGTHFYGWQNNGEGPSVEGVLKEKLSKIFPDPFKLQAASRTDRGVHAAQQCVHFLADELPDSLLYRLNRLLPPSIRILECKLMPHSFHSTLDVKSKIYTYSITNGPWQSPFERHFAWHVPQILNLNAMQEAADHLIGEHDFTSFCNKRKDHLYKSHQRRLIELTITQKRDCITLQLQANGFLYKMARNLVGTLVDVGRGKLPSETLPSILETRDRRRAGVSAPAHGLTLSEVLYEE